MPVSRSEAQGDQSSPRDPVDLCTLSPNPSGFPSRPSRRNHEACPPNPARASTAPRSACSAERAKEARKVADRLACQAWNYRMLGYKGPAQPSPALGDALNAGYLYLEVRCLGCNTHQTVALDVVRRPKAHRYTNLSGTCGVKTVRRSGVMRSRGATWWPCGPEGFPRVTRRQRGGREKDDRINQ
jgi:hypothetical protein